MILAEILLFYARQLNFSARHESVEYWVGKTYVQVFVNTCAEYVEHFHMLMTVLCEYTVGIWVRGRSFGPPSTLSHTFRMYVINITCWANPKWKPYNIFRCLHIAKHRSLTNSCTMKKFDRETSKFLRAFENHLVCCFNWHWQFRLYFC